MSKRSGHAFGNRRGASTSALLAVAVTLAICSVADVSAAAIILDLDRNTLSAQTAGRKPLNRLMGRLADAASQFSPRYGAGSIKLQSTPLALTHGPAINLSLITNNNLVTGTAVDRFHGPSCIAIRHHLTDLPPPDEAVGV